MNAENPYPIEIHHAVPFLDVVLCTASDIRSGRCDSENPDI